MRKIIAALTFLVLFTSGCVVEPAIYRPSIYTSPEPLYIVICKPTPDNGLYIWKKECLVLKKQ